jgi:hypothetical protein
VFGGKVEKVYLPLASKSGSPNLDTPPRPSPPKTIGPTGTPRTVRDDRPYGGPDDDGHYDDDASPPKKTIQPKSKSPNLVTPPPPSPPKTIQPESPDLDTPALLSPTRAIDPKGKIPDGGAPETSLEPGSKAAGKDKANPTIISTRNEEVSPPGVGAPKTPQSISSSSQESPMVFTPHAQSSMQPMSPESFESLSESLKSLSQLLDDDERYAKGLEVLKRNGIKLEAWTASMGAKTPKQIDIDMMDIDTLQAFLADEPENGIYTPNTLKAFEDLASVFQGWPEWSSSDGGSGSSSDGVYVKSGERTYKLSIVEPAKRSLTYEED